MLSEQAKVILSSASRGWSGIEAELLHISAGRHLLSGAPTAWLGVHFGTAVNADCRCDGHHHRGVQRHGDIDIVPAHLDGAWEDDGDCTILRLKVSSALLSGVAEDHGMAPGKASLRPNFQLRDPRLETLAWAIKAELEAEIPSENIYAETLGVALAVRLLNLGDHRGIAPEPGRRLSALQKRRLVDFIEARLDQSLSLADLAAVVGLGLSQFKVLFRNSFNEAPHRYLLRRRTERARVLLSTGETPIAQVALEAGFAHQSHMSARMRQLLGVTPGDIIRARRNG